MSTSFESRVRLKTDTSENWAKATNFTPLKGEFIFYSDLKKFKIGDGVTKVNDLEFGHDDDTTYSNATQDTAGLMSSADKIKIDNTKEIYVQSDEPVDSPNGTLWIDTDADFGDGTSAEDLVPITRTINGKTLSEDIILTANDVGAAPAGYGLGRAKAETVFFSVEELDAAQNSGWYRLNMPGNHSVIRVDSLEAGQCTQTRYFLRANANGSTNGVMMRNLMDGTWSEWEWVNPPMVMGVEYRTTERWNGKVVYAMAVDVGALPNSTTKGIWHMPVMTEVVDIIGRGKADAGKLVFPSPDIDVYINNEGAFVVHTRADFSGYTATATLKYTKD